MTNPIIERAARVIAAHFAHSASPDPALAAAQALDDLGLLSAVADPFAAPGRNRPAPTPAAVAALAECREAKNAACRASVETAGMPGEPEVTAAGGEVQIVVHPQSLDDWRQWLQMFRVGDAPGVSTGVAMVVRCTYSGVRARLVGVGVPRLYAAQLAENGAGAGP